LGGTSFRQVPPLRGGLWEGLRVAKSPDFRGDLATRSPPTSEGTSRREVHFEGDFGTVCARDCYRSTLCVLSDPWVSYMPTGAIVFTRRIAQQCKTRFPSTGAATGPPVTPGRWESSSSVMLCRARWITTICRTGMRACGVPRTAKSLKHHPPAQIQEAVARSYKELRCAGA